MTGKNGGLRAGEKKPAVFFTAEKGENDDFLWLKFSPAG